MSTLFEIEAFTVVHLDAIVALELQCFSMPWSRSMFIEELNNERAIYFVAVKDGLVIGYVGMWAVLNEGQITNIAVHPHYRRNKVACALLKRLELAATEKRLDSMTLEVRVSNRAAISLYQAHGFIREGIRKAYYADTGEDAEIFWKYLT